MRQQLDELRSFLDPGQKDPAMQRTVVVAHSMGGLLAKTLIVEPKESYWNTVFTRPLSSLNVTPKERASLKEAFYWKPRGHVDRVVYCSVPFHGSNWATSWVGVAGKWFIAPDPEFHNFYKGIEERNPGALTPDFASLMKGKVTSVATLTPKQKSIAMLADLHPVPGTATHVIAGSHDFFVSPESSAIPYAESSLTVPGGHGSFKSPQAVAEILRILRLPPVAKERKD
jgi:pimeloyl-ACP methyl ester carboxylesterase